MTRSKDSGAGPEAGETDRESPNSKRRRHRQLSGAVLGILFALAGLAAGRLGHLYPAFDVFSQFGMQFVLMALGFALALILPRYKAIAGFALTVAFIAAYGAWPHLVSDGLPKGPFPVAENEVIFTVAHFNSHEENRSNAEVEAEIRRLDADVVTLVEFSKPKAGILDGLAGQYPYRHAYFDKTYQNFAVLSKYPILAVDGKGVWEGPPYVSAKLGGKLESLTLYAVHTTRFPHFRAQLRQFRALVQELAPESGPMLMMGDFNATPFSRLPGIIEDGLGLRRVTHLPTWPAEPGLPQLAIDHIFLGKGLRVVAEQQIGNSAGSDHYPITMTLAFKPQ